MSCSDLEMKRKWEEIGCYIQTEDAGDTWDFTTEESDRLECISWHLFERIESGDWKRLDPAVYWYVSVCEAFSWCKQQSHPAFF